MAEELVTRVSLEGADQVNSQLNNIGRSGEESFGRLAEAVGRLDAVTNNFNRRMVQTHGRLKESAEGIGESFKELTETVGGAAEAFGSHFGEGGEVLGKAVDRILGVVGDIGLAFGALPKSAKAGVEGAAHEVEKLGAVGEEASSGLAGAFAGITRFAGPIAALAATAGAALGGLGYYAVESAEKFEHLKNSIAGISFEEFRGLAAVARDNRMSLETMVTTVANINEQFHEAAISAPLMADRLQFIGDRVDVMRKRMAISAQEHALSEEKASDQVADSYHNIEKSQQSAKDAQERYAEAVDKFQRHGRPLTHMEQQENEEKQRLKEMLSSERALKEAQRNADEAVHKHSDMLAQQQVQAKARNLQMEQEHTTLERVTNMQNRQTAMAIESASPIERLFLEHNKLVKGFGDSAADTQKNFDMLGKEMVGFVGKAPLDKLRAFTSMLLEMREHIRRMPEGEGKRAAQEIEDRIYLQGRIPDTFRRRLGEISEELGKPGVTQEERAAQTEGLAKRADELHIMREDQMEGLLQAGDAFQRALTDAGNIAVKFGEDVAKAGQVIAEKVSSLAVGDKAAPGEKATTGEKATPTPETTRAPIPGVVPGSILDKFFRWYDSSGADKGADKGKDRPASFAERFGGAAEATKATTEDTAATKDGTAATKDDAAATKTSTAAKREEAEAAKQAATELKKIAAPRSATAAGGVFGEVGGAATFGAAFDAAFRGRGAAAGTAGGTDATGVATAAAAKMFDAAGINDYVVGYDRHGREILASGHKRLAGWQGPGSNIRRVDDKASPGEPSPNVRRNRYVDDQGNPIEGQQHGGLVHGPGSETSDSVPIRASRGEYVMQAAAVQHFGHRFMDAINSMSTGGFVNGLSGYANGGSVSSRSITSGSDSLSYHALDIRTNAGSFRAHVDQDTLEALQSSALASKLSRTGERPSWFS